MVPDFDTAVERFKGFLVQQCLGTDILWIFREDAAAVKRGISVKVPLLAENESLARRYYSYGQERGLGLCIQMLCVLESRPCCFIWVPTDQTDAGCAMISGLKMSIPVERINARAVRSSCIWKIRRHLAKRSNMQWILDQLPARADIPQRNRQPR